MYIEEIINYIIYNNTTYNYGLFLLFVILGIIVGKLFNSVIKNVIKNIVKKSATKLDDIIYDSLELPLSVLVFLVFFYHGLRFINFPDYISILIYESFNVVIILSITWFLYNFVDSFFDLYIIPHVEKTENTFDDHIVRPLRKLLKLLIILFGILASLNAAGYDITTILAGLGIGGLAVALAAQDTLKNFIAGIIILVDKPFKLNEWIKIGDIEGIIEDVGLRSTKIRTFWDSLVIMPNSNIVDSSIENFSKMNKRRVLMTIGLTYDTPVEKIRKAKEILNDIIINHRGTVQPIRISFKEFGAYSLNIRVEYFIRNFGFDFYLDTIDEINLKIKEEFEKEGIEMAFPTQTIYVKNEFDDDNN